MAIDLLRNMDKKIIAHLKEIGFKASFVVYKNGDSGQSKVLKSDTYILELEGYSKKKEKT